MHLSKFMFLIGLFLLAACSSDAPKSANINKNSTAKETKPMNNTPASQPEVAQKTVANDMKEKEITTAKRVDAAVENGPTAEKPLRTTVEKAVAKTKTTANEKVVQPVEKAADKVVQETKKVATNIKEASQSLEEKKKEVKEVAQPKIVAATVKDKVEEKMPPRQAITLNTNKVEHIIWDQLLRKYVTDKGKVNYKGFKSDPKFETYLTSLQNNPVEDSWSRSEKMAYWINAYNAFTIKLITDNYPVASITKLHDGKPWDHAWIKLGDKTYTLNEIEHKILRPQFNDARIHFAVNCAATSCPPVLNRAWTASNLNKNLERQTKLFINDAKFNTISGDKVVVSKIFDWYKEDFGNLVAYLNKYAVADISPNADVQFMEYDWALNE